MSPSEAAEAALVFAVDGMHCASCGLLVDEVVEEVPGVSSSTTAIAEAGYTARPIP